MSKYSEIEQQTLDLDWFFTDGSCIGFVASAGGLLPDAINKVDDMDRLVKFFRSLPDISETDIVAEEEKYLQDFIGMSRKGLYSFDKVILNQSGDPNYQLVVRPRQPLRLKDLPFEIAEIIGRTLNFVDVNEIVCINISQDFS